MDVGFLSPLLSFLFLPHKPTRFTVSIYLSDHVLLLLNRFSPVASADLSLFVNSLCFLCGWDIFPRPLGFTLSHAHTELPLSFPFQNKSEVAGKLNPTFKAPASPSLQRLLDHHRRSWHPARLQTSAAPPLTSPLYVNMAAALSGAGELQL